MKKSFISLFLLTLILSHFSILNLWGADYLIPVTPGTNCYDGSKNVTEYNRRKIYIGSSGNWADVYALCPAAATYEVFAGFLTPNAGHLSLYLNNQDAGWHPLDGHNGWNVVDERTCGNRGFNAGSNKISLCYADAGYNATYIRLHNNDAQSTKTVPTSLDFYWSSKQENGDGAKVILNSDFMYDQKGEDYIKKSTVGGVNYSIFNANTTASSRDLVCFPNTGTYQFTFHVYASETNSDYQKPYVFVNSFMAGGGTFSLNNGSTTDIVIEMDVTAGTYPIAFYIPYSNHADRYHLSTVSIAQKVSCTPPNHVDISGNWDYFGGETISLTATAYSSAETGSPIDDANITGWQWQKWYNGQWNNVTDGTDGDATISGATTKNLQIANCSKNNSGSYQCVVSTGASCSTASGSEVVKVFTLECYNGGTTVYNFTRVGDTQSGTLELELNANTDYEFKFHVDTKFYGHNGHITADATNVVCYEKYNNADAPNITIKTGVEGGTFIIGMEYSTGGNNSNEGEPEISVTYPRKKIYFNPGGSTYWDQGGAQFALYYQRNSGENRGWTDIMSPFTCDGDVYSADIPLWHGVAINCARLNSSATNNNKESWWNTYKLNQTANITISASYNKYTITGWGGYAGADCTYSSSTYSPTTYTISFTGNGNSGGSMSNVTAIPCGEDRTLVANGFTKTGHSFSGWKTDVAVTANGSPVAANGIVADEATISNITSNITLTAQWTAKTSTITFDQNSGSGGQTSSLTATYGSAMPTPITAPTRTGYDFDGYYDGAGGAGTKYYNNDGTSAKNWDKENATWTLSAKWTAKDYTVTYSNPGNSNSYSISVDGGSAGSENKTAHYGNTITLVASAYTGYAFSSWTIKKTSDNSDVTAYVSLSGQTSTASFTMPAYGVTVTATFVETTCTNNKVIQCENSNVGASVTIINSGEAHPTPASATVSTDGDGYNGSGYLKMGSGDSDVGDAFFPFSVSQDNTVVTITVRYKEANANSYANIFEKVDAATGHIQYNGAYYNKHSFEHIGGDGNWYYWPSDFTDYSFNRTLYNKDYILVICDSKDGKICLDQITLAAGAGNDVFCEETSTTYDVTITGSPAAGQASATGAGSYEEGETVTINATPNRGYSFNTWSADPSVSFSSAATTASNSFSMPASDVALTASYNTLTSRTVTVNNDGNGSGSADLNPAYVGETVTLKATPNEGYRFVNWTTSDDVSFASSTSASTTFTMLDKNVTVQANFALVDNVIASGNANTMTGSYHDDQGSTLSGENVDADCVFEPNNVFKFTYTGFDGSGKYYGMDITKDAGYNSALSDGATGIGFYYMTEADNDGLAFCLDPKGNGEGSQYKMQLAATDGAWTYVYVAHSEADDWDGTFRFWINSNDNATDGDAATTTQQASGHFYIANISATAVTSKPTISKYAVTVSSNNDSYGTASGAGDFFDCESVTVTASKNNESYTFDGWYQGETRKSTELSYTFTMNDLRGESSSVALQARFSVSGYVVNYEVEGGNGTITSVKDGSGNDISNGEAVASGTVLTFTASPNSGYAVLGWYTYLNSTETLQGNTQNSNTFNYEVTGDITIRVKFGTPYTLTLNSSPAAASATVSGGGSYVQGTVVSVSTSTENGDYTFVHWMDGESVVSTSAASDYEMPASNKTLNAVYRQSRISSLSWSGSEDLGSGMEIASSCFDGGCFDTDVTFTFTGDGTVNYYDNTNRSSSLGTVFSGTAITLTDDLRAHGIYIQCTSRSATLTGVSKTTVGSVYTIWSGSVAVSADYTGVNEAGEEVTLRAEDQNWWLQQVVLGPEHFQTAAVGDTLRVTYTNIENEYAMGAIQTATKYNAIPGNIYKESDGSTVSSNTGEFTLPSSGYYHIITPGSLDSLKNKGIVVKGKGHTITRVSLHASCSNLSLRTTAPNVETRSGVDIMASSIDFGDGFDLGNWEHQVKLDKSCFTKVTVGSIINLYMSVGGDATLSFRCNVSSIIADDKQNGKGCPSYGDISFDRTIDDLYGHTPTVVGETEEYKVMYLKVDADMMRRLKETGMILCGKGTLIKVVEGVEETVTVMPNDNKPVPTVVNNIVIYQGGQVTNEEDIMVLGSITYIRPAKDDGTDGKLGNKLDQWYTFALPFTVSDVEVLDVVEEPDAWYDINAVYYSSDDMDQATNNPDGAGHYYLQYLKAENETAIGRDFAARWQYITPEHSERIYAYGEDRYGYPKKDSAYIILFDSDQPRELPSGYWDSNPTIRFVGVGPQTIDGVAKVWKVEANGEQFWMYANNTLHSFTLTDAYLLNDAGTEFVLQESPTIRPFECYVQATASLKAKYAAIPMRGFRIDNTTTGAESIQGSAIRAEKILRNGQLIIIRNGVEYDATGVVIR